MPPSPRVSMSLRQCKTLCQSWERFFSKHTIITFSPKLRNLKWLSLSLWSFLLQQQNQLKSKTELELRIYNYQYIFIYYAAVENIKQIKSEHILIYQGRQCEGWWAWLLGRLGDPADDGTMTESEGLSLAWSWPEDHAGEQSWLTVDSWHARQQLRQSLCQLVSFLEHL